MKYVRPAVLLVAFLALTAPLDAHAQLADTKILTAEAVKALLTTSETTARENRWNLSIAVTDAAGELIGFLRMDNASPASGDIAIGKARTAARFRRPTKIFADRILNDTLTLLSVPGVVALQGGLPIVVDGRVVGAVGVSGATSAQDEQVAAAAIAAVIKP